MPNNESLQRSEILTNKAESFFEYKSNYFKDIKKISSKQIMNYFHVSTEEWNNWKWQLQNKIINANQLKEMFNLKIYEYEKIKNISTKYRFAITPYYLSLIREFHADDPIYLQCIPQSEELCNCGKFDPMNEMNNNPAGTITRRYPDRATINVTNCCATFCRHCQRKRNIKENDLHTSISCLEESYEYINNHPEIRDVLVTGGDPFTLSDNEINNILERIRNIETVEIIRIGTRIPVTMPQRITKNLIHILKKYSPVYINTQFNHPFEITKESSKACLDLAENGMVLSNQMVFLKDVNTDYFTLQLLNQLLLSIKVRPYYIFHPKDVIGTRHFYISIEEGIQLYEKLRGNTSGLAIPTYIINAENGQGKISLNKEMLKLVQSDGAITLESWEGNKITLNIRGGL